MAGCDPASQKLRFMLPACTPGRCFAFAGERLKCIRLKKIVDAGVPRATGRPGSVRGKC